MKKVLVVIIASILLISSVFEVQPLVNANPMNGFVNAPSISIQIPGVSIGGYYPSNSISVLIEVKVLETGVAHVYSPQILSISYSIDSMANVTFLNFTEGGQFVAFPDMSGNYKRVRSLSVSSTLTNLAEGNHTLKAYSLDSDGKEMSTERTFLVDTIYVKPKVSIISPQNNQVYASNKIPFTFWVNTDFKSASYCIDIINASSSISGNTTLSNLSDGKHKILLSVTFNDKYQKFPILQGAYFNVNTTKTENNLPLDNQNPSVPGLSWLIILPLLLSVFSVALIFRHRKEVKKI
jgi:hypothetical protein